MTKLLTGVLLCSSCALLHADFMYQETTQMTGGSLYNMMQAAGPFARQAREPNVSTHLIKGNRMATLTKDRATVIDLDKETITTMDLSKKTYTVMTFAEMKQMAQDAAQRMQGRQAGNQGDNNVQANFKVSAQATGQTKTIQGLNAKEMVITMTMEGTDQKSGQSGAMTVTTDGWFAPVPGYDEVKAFHRKMGEKLGYAFGSGNAQMGMMRPQVGKGFEEVAKEMSKIDGVPVESVVKMSSAGNGSAAPDGSQAQAQQGQDAGSTSAASAAAAAALGRFGMGRKKKDDQGSQGGQSGAAGGPAGGGSLIETTSSLTSFSSATVDASKFEVPEGFKQVQRPERGRPQQ